ncbi:hypothetical protein [Curtobacterium sp. VKM Ac-1395]|uniref:hypothetical protein n=1 Tax=Curtobacterium sp. VKM Ac-1395 TaxID=2783815 RepID=UPI00188B7736|nr:hypothetical protein [Curtobacterium sp. VKM Ac-1395]MBF4592016.1 hypothetical protein [Curtobacterium sp. VKM Ac-1395]
MDDERTAARQLLARLQELSSVEPVSLAGPLQQISELRAADHASLEGLLPDLAWQTAGAIAAADDILEALGAPWHWAPPATEEAAWLQELRKGLDTFSKVCWFLRFGYTAGAVALARQFIERWTYNLSSTRNIWPDDGEEYADFLRRVWSVYPAMVDGRDFGQEWADLSELLHGRSITRAGRTITINLSIDAVDRAEVHQLVVQAAEMALRQVRGAIDTAHASTAAVTPISHGSLQLRVEQFPPTTPPEFLTVTAPPLDYSFVTSDLADTISDWGATYRRIVANRSKDPVNMLTFAWMAIEERWARAIDHARQSFREEQSMLGDAFSPVTLDALILFYRCITEMTELLARTSEPSTRTDALQAAASALESSWVLWLQDVDESLICMRTVLENTARARTHRLKPERAATMELRGAATTPHRWLDAAGWGRLSAFNRALGEFSHTQARSRHEAARDLLTSMQRGETASADHTARARALEEVATMLAHETSASLEQAHPRLAEAFRKLILNADEADADDDLNAWLDHGLRFRSFDFGPTLLDRATERRRNYDKTVSDK